ncbi:MAG: NAD(P)/FAD-dependent oxidoreductase [Gemmataceae bacterium]
MTESPAKPSATTQPVVVVVGGGFGGLQVVRALARSPVQVVLIDRENYHLFQPLLYQVATGGLSPADISSPLRSIFKNQKNVTIIQDEVQDFDIEGQSLITRKSRVPYDYLVLATGSRTSYFGNDQWAGYSHGLKSLEEAIDIRKQIYGTFEEAECLAGTEKDPRPIRFVVVGGGPTGVEMTGAIAELTRHTLRGEFKRIDPTKAEVLLLEGGGRVLANYDESLSNKAQEDLEDLGAHVRTNTFVTNIDQSGVKFKNEQQEEEFLEADLVLWAAGVRASSLSRKLHEKTGVELDRSGRICVNKDLSVPNHPNIFALGDMVLFLDEKKQKPLPGVAPVAMQQGYYVGKKIDRQVIGEETETPFEYTDKGMLAVIGRAAAIGDIRGWKFTGFFAWFVWLFVHLMFLVEFQSRVLVFIQWGWNYFTRNRSARLITNTRELRSD